MQKQFFHFFSGLAIACGVFLSGQAQAQDDQPPRKQELPTGPPMYVPQPPQPVQIIPPDSVQPRQKKQVQQEEKRKEREQVPLKDKLFVGGGAGLSFSSSTTFGKTFYAAVSPMLGYKVSNRLAFGPGLNYQYWGTDYGNYHNYGGRLFGQFIVVDELFSSGDKLLVHSEYELMNYEAFRLDSRGRLDSYRMNVGTVLAGLGYRQQMGHKSAIDFYLLYNATESVYSPYGALVTRFGLIFDL